MTREAVFILVVEDHPTIRENTLLQLRDHGFAARGIPTADEARALLTSGEELPDLVLLDIRLGKDSGIDLLRQLREAGIAPPTIVMSGAASMSETVDALRLGVYDFIEKPFTRERLVQSVTNCLEHVSLKRELTTLRSSRAREGQILIGRSPQIVQLRERISRVAPTAARILVRGESGTGKELVGNAVHAESSRKNEPFVKLNCAAIPPHLIEDELFGHARGAFTDAKAAKPGLFEEAHRGTLLLDEIGDMDLLLQSRLLRVLEDGKVRRIGETQDRAVDVRVIAATNRDLEELVRDGKFREDLFFRIATVTIPVPPLRERAGDVALLFSYFLEEFCARNQRRKLSVDPAVFPLVERYRWPGNVRELRNVCEHLSIFAADPITPDQLPSSMLVEARDEETGLLRLGEGTALLPLHDFKERCEKEYVEHVLRRTNWNVTAAAKLLQIRRTYLHHKLTTLKISKPT